MNKNRKLQKIRVKENRYDFKRILLLYGVYGLRSLEGIRLKDTQIESVKKTIKKIIKKLGTLWVLVKADKGVTQKPQQVRMGKGKGNYSYSVVVVQKGTILFEIGWITFNKKTCVKSITNCSRKITN